MDFYDYYNPYELTHWGIKGMKWGVRRFQNKDGSLTIDGGKRYNGSDYQPRKSLGERIGDYKKTSKRKAALKKARATKEANRKAAEAAKAAAEQRKKDVESGKIKPKDMTNEELNSRIERMNTEKRYQQLMNETNPPSKIESEANAFINKMWKEAIMPAAAEAGKQIVKDSLLKAAKGNKEVEEFDLDKFWNNRNKKTTQEIKEVSARLLAEESIKRKIDSRKEEADAQEAAKKQAKAEKKAKEQAMKDYEQFQKEERERRENPSPYSKTTYDTRDNNTEYHNRRDYVDPNKESRVEYPPTITKPNSTKVTNIVKSSRHVRINSQECDDKSNKGEQEVYDILDKNGNIIVTKKRK